MTDKPSPAFDFAGAWEVRSRRNATATDVLLGGYHPPLIAGGAGFVSDCRAEWLVVNALNTPFYDSKSRVNPFQVCRDGDVTCDADRTVNSATGPSSQRGGQGMKPLVRRT